MRLAGHHFHHWYLCRLINARFLRQSIYLHYWVFVWQESTVAWRIKSKDEREHESGDKSAREKYFNKFIYDGIYILTL